MNSTSASKAFEYAHELALRVLEGRIRVEQGTRDPLAHSLAAAELHSLMVYAGVLVRIDESQVRRLVEDLKDPTSRPRLSAEALRAMLEGTKGVDEIPPGRAFKIVERYVRADPDVPVRARYNVACFYSRLADHDVLEADDRNRSAARALVELDLALNDATLLPWAEKDPSLKPLAKGWPQTWAETIQRHRPKEAQTGSTS